MPVIRRLSVALLMASLASCGSTDFHHSLHTEEWHAQADQNEQQGLHPHPFTTNQIRAACEDGHWNLFEIRRGDEVSYSKGYFLNGDEAGVDLVTDSLDADGRVLTKGEPMRARWVDLKNHATFPKDRSRFVRYQRMTTAFGEQDCMVYEMVNAEGNVSARFVFGYDFPGPPLIYQQFKAGQEVFRMEVTARRGMEGP